MLNTSHFWEKQIPHSQSSLESKNDIQNGKQTVNNSCEPEGKWKIGYKTHISIELYNVESSSDNQATHIKSIPFYVECRQKLQIGKTNKK